MPTFEQIESLQTVCYIHKKSGWCLYAVDLLKEAGDDRIAVVFNKNESCVVKIIQPDGSVSQIDQEKVQVDN
jgi:hypothetical protein